MKRICIFFAVILTSCVAISPQISDVVPIGKSAIWYSSTSTNATTVFDGDKIYSGPPIIETTMSRIMIGDQEGISCISIGPISSSTEYAIKRPIKKTDSYTCNGTIFYVVDCIDSCREAVVRAYRGPEKVGVEENYFVVDFCKGITNFNVLPTGQSTKDTETLRGTIGILNAPDSGACS